MNKVIRAIRNEIIEILPAIIYFLVVFNLVHSISVLLLDKGVQHYYSYLSVSIEALVVGKVLIIANAMPFIDAFPRKPLIYNIVWKFIIYSIFLFIAWNLEYSIHLYLDYHSWSVVWQHVIDLWSRPPFWASEILVLFLLAVFVVFHEIMGAVGRRKVLTLLFIQRH